MKRIGNLWDRLTSYDNLLLAHKNARKGKLHYKDVIAFDSDVQKNVLTLQHALRQKTWTCGPYRRFIVREHGKARQIDWDPVYIDNVVQHAVEQVAGKILIGTLITDTYSGICGRGIHYGVKRIRKFLAEYPELAPIYILKMDVRKFYPSVNLEILKAKIRRKIKDPDVLNLINKILDSHPSGLPIGNYLSQLFANFYLSDLDHWIKGQGIKHYSRYCDDIVLIHHDKSVLKSILPGILDKLSESKLAVKENYQIFPIERFGLDYLGYIFTRKKVRLRKSVERSFRRAANRYNKRPNVQNIRRLTAYWGWIKYLTSGKRLWNSLLNYNIKQLQEQTK